MLQRNRAARLILHPIYRSRALENYLRRGQLFAGLSAEQNQRSSEFLRARADVEFVQVDPGQALFRQGNPADSFYILALGHVAVQQTSPHGHTLTLNYLGRGQSFGEIGLLSRLSDAVARAMAPAPRGTRTTTCMALDHVEVVAVSALAFAGLLEAEPAIAAGLERTALDLLG